MEKVELVDREKAFGDFEENELLTFEVIVLGKNLHSKGNILDMVLNYIEKKKFYEGYIDFKCEASIEWTVNLGSNSEASSQPLLNVYRVRIRINIDKRFLFKSIV